VTLGQAAEGGLRVIKSGLTADDVVIVNGLMRVRPGAKVTPEQAAVGSSVKDTASIRMN
jgi:hypothetical protein